MSCAGSDDGGDDEELELERLLEEQAKGMAKIGKKAAKKKEQAAAARRIREGGE